MSQLEQAISNLKKSILEHELRLQMNETVERKEHLLALIHDAERQLRTLEQLLMASN